MAVGQPGEMGQGPQATFAAPEAPTADPGRRAAAAAGLTRTQVWLIVVLVTLGGCLLVSGRLWTVVRVMVGLAVLAASAVRVAACAVAPPTAASAEGCPPEGIRPAGIFAEEIRDGDWPLYTVILALYREAEITPQLMAAIEALDYPRDRLQVIAAVEADDASTVSACWRAGRALGLELAFAEGAAPRTKPRALNAALARTRGDLLVVYDAEDRPHPGQLREAARAFARAGPGVAVLQAPLRIPDTPGLRELQHQFRLEYAALFDVLLPFLARLGLPFPLGGTSNHIRRATLEDLGGWDPWNVTEDADLGFVIVAAGYRAGVIRLPTLETAPHRTQAWIAQRSRWLKGHMQTLGVHSRDLRALGWRGGASLVLCLGFGVASAGLHGPMVLWLMCVSLPTAFARGRPALEPLDALVLGLGWGGALLCMAVGVRRAGGRLRWRSLALAPAFWTLQSAALVRALWQLRTRPHHWDKTDHSPVSVGAVSHPVPVIRRPPLDGTRESGLSGGRDPLPSLPFRRGDDASHRPVG